MRENYFEILGIRIDASEQEIQHAYRELAKRYHPDINPGDIVAEEKMKQINTAYTVLSNKSTREKYVQEVMEKTNFSKKYDKTNKQCDNVASNKADKYKSTWQKMMNYYYETR